MRAQCNRALAHWSIIDIYPFISHLSFSKPLWIDCAMEDSIRSTYLITCGAKVSRICWWNLPFFRLSKKIFGIKIGSIMRLWHMLWWPWMSTHHQFWGSHWGPGRGGRSPRCLEAVQRGPGPCPQRTGTRTVHCVPLGGHWTKRRPANTIIRWWAGIRSSRENWNNKCVIFITSNHGW